MAFPRLGPVESLRRGAWHAACNCSHTASRLWMSPVMRSEISPRLVATVTGPSPRDPLSCDLCLGAKKGSRTHTQLPRLKRRCRRASPGNRFARNTCQIWVPGSKPCPSKVNVARANGSVAVAKMKTTVMKAAMSGLYHSGAHRLLAPYTQGAGVIFTLHHVRPEPDRPNAFAPNRFLEVTPELPRRVARSSARRGPRRGLAR